jgi:methylated-DNA-[protein]-cysteine S-methyltransferase
VRSFRAIHQSPVGPLVLVGAGTALRGLYVGQPPRPEGEGLVETDSIGETPLAPVAEQLDEYFAGRRRSFDLQLDLSGTPFQRLVWNALRQVAYGATTTYGELAAALGRPGAARAVGAANARNPISIVVPCHRVIGANGALTGYGGGLDTKRRLLDLERAVVEA